MSGASQFWRVARATVDLELAQLRRQRVFLLLAVVAALSFLATVSLFGLTGSELPVGLADAAQSPHAAQLRAARLSARHAFALEALDAESAARALRRGRLVAVLTVPRGFGAAVDRGETVALPLEVDNLNLDLLSDVQRALPSAILAFGQALGLPGLRVRLAEKDLVPRDTGFLAYISVSALGLVAFLIGAMLGALALAREWEGQTAKLIGVAPARAGAVVAGKIAAGTLGAGLAVGAAALLVVLGYRIQPVAPVSAALGLGLCTVVFVSFGAFVGSAFRRSTPVVPLLFGLAMPLYIDCGALEPTRFDGERIWQLAHLSPLYYSTGVLEWVFHGLRVTPEPVALDALVLALFGRGCPAPARRRLARGARCGSSGPGRATTSSSG